MKLHDKESYRNLANKLAERVAKAESALEARSNIESAQMKTIIYAISLLEIEGDAAKALQYLREALSQHNKIA